MKCIMDAVVEVRVGGGVGGEQRCTWALELKTGKVGGFQRDGDGGGGSDDDGDDDGGGGDDDDDDDDYHHHHHYHLSSSS